MPGRHRKPGDEDTPEEEQQAAESGPPGDRQAGDAEPEPDPPAPGG
jgi:hypothetical protein